MQDVTHDESLSSLLQRSLADDGEDHWLALYRRLGRLLDAYIRRVVGGRCDFQRDLSEELAQEVYCRLLEKDRRILRRLEGAHDRQIRAYLRSVCTSVALDHLRREWAAKRGRDETRPWDPATVLRVEDPRSTPEQAMVVREMCRELARRYRARAPSAKTARNLRIFELAFVQGWSSHDISDELDNELKPSSIDSLLQRMKGVLAREVAPARRAADPLPA